MLDIYDPKNDGKKTRLYCHKCKRKYIMAMISQGVAGYGQYLITNIGTMDTRDQMYRCVNCK